MTRQLKKNFMNKHFKKMYRKAMTKAKLMMQGKWKHG